MVPRRKRGGAIGPYMKCTLRPGIFQVPVTAAVPQTAAWLLKRAAYMAVWGNRERCLGSCFDKGGLQAML